MSFSDIYYDQHLQSLPQVLQESAVEFDKLKAIIQHIVDELTETGLSPQLLRGHVNGDSHEPSDAQETGIDGDRTPETAQGTSNPVLEITQQPSMLRRPKVVYELKSESDQLVSQLRVWISPPPLQAKSGKDDSIAGLTDDVPDTLDSSALTEGTKESKAGCMVVSPSVLRAAVKGINVPLGMEKMANTDSNFGHERFGTLKPNSDSPNVNDQSSEHRAAITDKTNKVEFVVPLVRDAEFFTTLAHNLDDVSSKIKQLYSVFSETVADLAKTIADTCQPASVAANFHPYSSVTTHAGTVEVKANNMKSDLYAWRDIFRLYVEAEVFEYNNEGVKGEWSLDESEKRLKSFVNKAAQGWLPVNRNEKQQRLVKGKGLGGSKQFKYKQNVGALETFIKLNLLTLDIKKFLYVTAEAITDLLGTRTERSALPTPFSLKDGIPSSPSSSVALHSPLQHPSFLIVDSLAPALLEPFVHSIETTVLPIVPSLDDYSCVICMNIAFKPVRLSCTHLFCVRCLVKMQKRGKGSCPMCRARSVLCANSTNVDWALLNFMEDWFPREAREKLKANEKEVTTELSSEWAGNQCCVT